VRGIIGCRALFLFENFDITEFYAFFLIVFDCAGTWCGMVCRNACDALLINEA
jgi:hypothetical protein